MKRGALPPQGWAQRDGLTIPVTFPPGFGSAFYSLRPTVRWKMSDQGEFNWDDQQENLERVSSRIARAVLAFCEVHRRFHAEELRKFVIRETGISAPGSADRILRDLRKRGLIDYRVLSRRGSYYEVLAIRGKELVTQ